MLAHARGAVLVPPTKNSQRDHMVIKKTCASVRLSSKMSESEAGRLSLVLAKKRGTIKSKGKGKGHKSKGKAMVRVRARASSR